MTTNPTDTLVLGLLRDQRRLSSVVLIAVSMKVGGRPRSVGQTRLTIR